MLKQQQTKGQFARPISECDFKIHFTTFSKKSFITLALGYCKTEVRDIFHDSVQLKTHCDNVLQTRTREWSLTPIKGHIWLEVQNKTRQALKLEASDLNE